MDLVGAISGLQQAKVIGQVQMAVAARILDIQQFQGDVAVQLIQAASQGVNQAGDALVAASTGLGAHLDVYA